MSPGPGVAWLFRLGLAGIALFWLGVVAIVAAKRRIARWRIGPDSPGIDPPVPLSVVIPARDEADNIEACVRAAMAQDLDDVEVVVLDDGSTDGTAEILARLAAELGPRLRVITGGADPPPAGWSGKAWACQRAASEASAPWLLFIDADVVLHPHAASAALAWARAHDLGMVSGLGHLEARSFWEKVLQPLVGGLVVAGHDLDRTNDPARREPRPLANGQFLLLRRDAYEAVGGHAAVSDAILDDMGMAVAVIAAGYDYNLLMMRELFSCRMYRSLGELWRGWSKNLFTGMERSYGRLIGLSLVLFAVHLVPWVVLGLGLAGVVGREWLLWGGGLVAVVLGARLWLDRAYDMDLRYSWSQPLGAVMLLALLWDSALRTTVSRTAVWKGRTLSLDTDEARRTIAATAAHRARQAQAEPGSGIDST
ncbi:MAG: glycosyltransferase [Deltaproteobacteria bacterium]|nr:MAG: glycosyltransferase [Deltaproteobacteria bacterium]